MKKSRHIKLVLLGAVSGGALSGCGPGRPPVASADLAYPNNYYVAGFGYYHAPFRGWYSLPYNHYDPQTRLYYFGGHWAAGPHQSFTNVSSPTPEMARAAQASQNQTSTYVPRGGFGRTSHHYSTYS